MNDRMTDQRRALPIEEVADRCFADMAAGATVQECLAQWPEHRGALEPMLLAALDLAVLAPLDVPAAPNPARRAAFMAEIRSTPQQSARRLRLPALPSFAFPTFAVPSVSGMALRFGAVALPAAAIAVFALAIVLTQGGTRTASAATLTVFSGEVEYQVDGQWEPLTDGASVREGVSIRTGAGGRALITFGDGSTAVLGGATEILLERLALNGDRDIELAQASGRLWSDVVTGASASGGASYVVRTPHAVVEAHGTVFETVVDGETTVATTEGLVQVVRGASRIDVPRGQAVTTTAESVAAPRAIAYLGQITVRGPVAAALTAPDGAATGLLPSGFVFRQLPGVATTARTDGQQEMSVGDIQPGVYSLWLRRFDDGDGVVVIETAGDLLTVPVPAGVENARVQLAIDIVDGDVVMRALDTQVERNEQAPPVRLVETPRSRAAVALRAAAAAATSPATSAATSAATERPATQATTDTTDPTATTEA
ncbi:MAG: FecR family protein, partial [Dehalococcoidia bacterium]